MLRKKLSALLTLLALLVVVGTVVATATPASASYATCPAGQSCLYTGANGAGAQTALAFSAYDPVGSCHNLTLQPIGGYHSAKGGFGSGHTFVIYSATNCGGSVLAILPAGATWSNEFSRPYSMIIG